MSFRRDGGSLVFFCSCFMRFIFRCIRTWGLGCDECCVTVTFYSLAAAQLMGGLPLSGVQPIPMLHFVITQHL